MTQKMLIDATHAEETRVVVVDGNKVDEFDFESLNKRQLAGNIYLAKVTRVEPSLQAAFVDYGGNRHGFLAFSEVHPDYYQIPRADREALLREEAEAAREEEEAAAKPKARGRSRSRRPAQAAAAGDATVASPPTEDPGTDVAVAGDPLPVIGADFDDAPPPNAASGEFDIDVPDEPGEASGGGDEYESVGGDDVAEERSPRKPRQRRYKIQEVIKVRQILLVQVVKEERGNKGAALTTYLSLAGRYCVLMPNTARGGGISRKITNVADRKKLKEISASIIVPEGAGLIIRTAGSNRTKTEIKRDYEYLLRQWEQIRDLTLKSIAPAPIYEEGSLIKRVIRDLYSRDIDEILVDGERGYREAKDYMKMLMPSHAKYVKHYAEPLPLFSRFQVESYLSAMFNPVVQLKSGGYIVIDVTEALVAIDVNSGRATREASIEDTALKTNLEAAEEAARQMRLRDLAGLIVIDFIDMEDRRNNAAVEKKLKDKLKSDRARIQVGRISGFGLLEMSRQRLRPGMIEATTKSCPHCHGTGRVRSDDSMALALLREIEEEAVRQRSKEVLIVAPVEIANYLLNQKREHVAAIEMRFGLSVRVEGDGALISPDFRIERFKTASRIIPAAVAMDLPKVAYPDEDETEAEIEADEAEDEAAGAEASAGEDAGAAGDKPGKRRRRRRRRGGARQDGEGTSEGASDQDADAREVEDAGDAAPQGEPEPAAARAEGPEAAPAPSKSRRRSRGKTAEPVAAAEERSPFGDVVDVPETVPELVDVPEANAPQRRGKPRVRVPAAAVLEAAAPTERADQVAEPEAMIEAEPEAMIVAEPEAMIVAEPEAVIEAEPEAMIAPEPEAMIAPEAEAMIAPEPEPVPVLAEALVGVEGEPQAGGPQPLAESEPEAAAGTAPETAPEPEPAAGAKRRGWWSRALTGG